MDSPAFNGDWLLSLLIRRLYDRPLRPNSSAQISVYSQTLSCSQLFSRSQYLAAANLQANPQGSIYRMMKSIKYSVYFCGVFGIIITFLLLLSVGNGLFQQTKNNNSGFFNKASEYATSIHETVLPEASRLFENNPTLSNVRAAQEQLGSDILKGLTGKEDLLTAGPNTRKITPKVFDEKEIQKLREQAEGFKESIEKQSSQLGEFKQ